MCLLFNTSLIKLMIVSSSFTFLIFCSERSFLTFWWSKVSLGWLRLSHDHLR